MFAAVAMILALGGSVVVLLAVMLQAARRQSKHATLLMTLAGDCPHCAHHTRCPYAAVEPTQGASGCPLARTLALKAKIDSLEV